MTLEVLQKEMITALKAGDKFRKETISAVVGAIKKAAIDERCKDNITEELVNKVILKEKKMTQEMIDTCPVDRVTTLEEYRQRLSIIEEFTPKMLSENEVRQYIYESITSNDIKSLNKGMLMKVVMPKLKGKADGKLINMIVSEIIEKEGV